MDDRGYVAQAWFDRLSGEGVEFRVLGDSDGYPERAPAEVQLAVPAHALGAIPRLAARFCQELDLQLVQLAPRDSRAWGFTLAWSDEVGRPRFVSARVCSDYCRGARRYLRADELLGGLPDTLFGHGLVDAVETLELPPERAAWLCRLWAEDARGAIERIARFFPSSADIRLVAQAAKHGDWTAVRGSLPRLRRALRRKVMPEPADVLARLAVAARNLLQPARASVAFLGRESSVRSAVLAEVQRDLAPLGLTIFEAGAHAPRADVKVVFDGIARRDGISISSSRGIRAAVLAVQRGILRWLECRVERRFPRALVGDNPAAARVLQFAARHGIPGIQLLMNCDIRCALGSPVLMPHPFGIVIGPGVTLGSRVTVMHQVTVLGEVVIEDNVTLGPGAKIIGDLKVGRGATVGPNAVVTEDVPSHDTVVVEKRRPHGRHVVNV
jgi:serine O-acetyltransferase